MTPGESYTLLACAALLGWVFHELGFTWWANLAMVGLIVMAVIGLTTS